jgi:hypothetical protein
MQEFGETKDAVARLETAGAASGALENALKGETLSYEGE